MCVRYLWNADPSTRLEEVLNVSSTLGHGEFGLQTQRPVLITSSDLVSCSVIIICTHHGGGGDVDAGDGSWSHVIGQVTEHHPVRQSCSQVAGQRHLQASLDILGGKTDR